MQIIVEVGIDPARYVNEQYQRRVRAPSVCANCGRAQALEAHGYYWRWVTALCGLVIQIAVRRFCCRHCPVTVSCLPEFAQPYRLVCNQSIEGFFGGEKDPERRGALAGVAGPLSTTLRGLFGRAARGVRGALRTLSAPGGTARLLEPGDESLWRPGRRHRQVGPRAGNNTFRALSLSPKSGFVAIKAEALAASALAGKTHTSCLWHSARAPANARGRHAKGARCEFAGAGVDPAQRGKLDPTVFKPGSHPRSRPGSGFATCLGWAPLFATHLGRLAL
jgi:hypothetical protein